MMGSGMTYATSLKAVLVSRMHSSDTCDASQETQTRSSVTRRLQGHVIGFYIHNITVPTTFLTP